MSQVTGKTSFKHYFAKYTVVLLVFLCCLLTLAPVFNIVYADGNGDIIVHVTKTGEKYHLAGCSYLKSDIPITLEEATRSGYTPCSRCHPPVLDTSATNSGSNNYSESSNDSVQASASINISVNGAENGDVTVYYTDSGNKYHRKDCTYLQSSHDTTLYIAVVEKELDPCSRCHPPVLGEPSEHDEDPYVSSGSSYSSSSSSSSSKTTSSTSPNYVSAQADRSNSSHGVLAGIGALIMGVVGLSSISNRRQTNKANASEATTRTSSTRPTTSRSSSGVRIVTPTTDVFSSHLTCPRCGGKLVLRTARRGYYAGQQFYGCSNYPRCKYLKNIK